MGFFTRSSKVKKKHPSSSSQQPPKEPPRPSLTAPPNVFTSRPPPPPSVPKLPQRPATTAPTSSSRPRPQQASGNDKNHPYRSQHRHGNQSQPQLRQQPAGYLPPPPGWRPAPIPTTAPQQQQQLQLQQPIIVNQHYYLSGGPQFALQNQSQPQLSLSPPNGQSSSCNIARLTDSMVNLARDARDFVPLRDFGPSNCAQGLFDDIFNRFDNVMTLIDRESCSGNEKSLFSCQSNSEQPPPPPQEPGATDRSLAKWSSKKPGREPKPPTTNDSTTLVSGSYFAKVELYANARLPADLPPLSLYMPTWPILCLAAQYSQRVYDVPKGRERDAHVSADWRTGAKAMCIKSVPMDHVNTIVFAIRGTSTFMDWAVNLNTAPASPEGFLDDPGNYCHAGFLSVAKKMVKPVAARLRQMLEEDPGRASYSLLITGHSAGGAVAALLYSHMLTLNPTAESELNVLAGCFKRIHCVTFGTPPVTLLPLMKPNRPELRKSIFLSFVNEGDPVVRADKAYVKSLLELLASPTPTAATKEPPPPSTDPRHKTKQSSSTPRKSKSRPNLSLLRSPKPSWKVPPSTLSNAGRIVVLRSGDARAKPKDRKTMQERLDEGVVAVTCREDQLRDVIWGDPVCHLMSLYAARIEVLAVGAVTAKRW